MEPRQFVYTVSQAARLLQVAENTVLEAIRRGQLPAFQVGDRWRIPVAGLFALGKGAPLGWE